MKSSSKKKKKQDKKDKPEKRAKNSPPSESESTEVDPATLARELAPDPPGDRPVSKTSESGPEDGTGPDEPAPPSPPDRNADSDRATGRIDAADSDGGTSPGAGKASDAGRGAGGDKPGTARRRERGSNRPIGTDELRVQGLEKRFGKKEAVRGVDFAMRSGQVVSLLGPNGAGKTTVFYMIVGFVRPTDGQVYFNRTDITRMPMFRRARLGISYLPQEPSVFRKLTVEQNLLAVLEPQKHLNRRERYRRAGHLIEELGLEGVRRQRAYTLSGGERRRTEIARALATEPRFLLLDEPFAGIDPRARYEIKTIVRHLSKRDIGVLITDHNERDTLEISDYSYLIHQGRIVVSGTKEEVAANETARHVYLGHDYRN